MLVALINGAGEFENQFEGLCGHHMRSHQKFSAYEGPCGYHMNPSGNGQKSFGRHLTIHSKPVKGQLEVMLESI